MLHFLEPEKTDYQQYQLDNVLITHSRHYINYCTRYPELDTCPIKSNHPKIVHAERVKFATEPDLIQSPPSSIFFLKYFIYIIISVSTKFPFTFSLPSFQTASSKERERERESVRAQTYLIFGFRVCFLRLANCKTLIIRSGTLNPNSVFDFHDFLCSRVLWLDFLYEF